MDFEQGKQFGDEADQELKERCRPFWEAQAKLLTPPDPKDKYALPSDAPKALEVRTKDFTAFLQLIGLSPTPEEAEQKLQAVLGEYEDGAETPDVIPLETILDNFKTVLKEYRTEDDLKDAFRTFDPEERGVIAVSDLRFILTSLGDKLTTEEMNQFIAEAVLDTDTDGLIGYDGLANKFVAKFINEANYGM